MKRLVFPLVVTLLLPAAAEGRKKVHPRSDPQRVAMAQAHKRALAESKRRAEEDARSEAQLAEVRAGHLVEARPETAVDFEGQQLDDNEIPGQHRR
jgi:hypothetical protein